MATTSLTALRRFAGFAGTLLLLNLCLMGGAAGQGAPPLVTASFPAGLNHPTGWGTIQETAIDSYGDWLVVEYPDGGLFEFPAGGGPMISLVPLGGLGAHGGYQNPSIAIDPDNNLYVGGNWNNCLLMFPYDTTTHTWDGLSTLTPSNPSSNLCSQTPPVSPYLFAEGGTYLGISPYYFQPWGIAIGNKNNIVIGSQNSGNFIFSLPVTGGWTSPVAGSTNQLVILGMTKRPNSLAQDPEGNIYFVEDSGGLSGVYEIPAGTTGLTSDAGLTRVDPSLPSVTGVITDAAGNLYISDSQNGVYLVPNPSGTPQTASASLLTPVPAQGEVALDAVNNILYVPTTQTQSNNQKDVARVGFGYAEFGLSTIGTQTSPAATIAFGFNGSATPARFTIVEDGATTPDFAITGGTCTTGTAYAANSGCIEDVAMTPTAVGNLTAKLMMLDANNKILSSIVLHGTGVGPNIQAAPGLEATVGSGLKTPTQVAVDSLGNLYVADGGLGKVLMYAAGSGASATPVSIGTGLTQPTGVAVDGSGDVFIADSGTGRVYEIPFGPSGLNASGQLTLVSGLGVHLNLAADGLGGLYIADPLNKRVVKLSNVGASSSIGAQAEVLLTAGFNAPSAVAVDSNNNLYVIDGANLFLLQGGAGTPTTLLSNLSGATGLAVDPSGAVYISSTGGTERIPAVSGTLQSGSSTAIAADVTSTSSVSIDRLGDVVLTPAGGGSLTTVSVNGTLNFGNVALGVTPSLNAVVTNIGNATLSVTGYTSTNAVDYTAADGTCIASSPLASGASCLVDVTLSPGAGEQGTLTSQIGITSNAINSPVLINTTGVGAAVASSVTAVTIGGTAQVINTPVTVNLTPKTGTGTPSGNVTVTFTSWTVYTPTSGTGAGVPTIKPVTGTMTAVLNNKGTATFNLTAVLAGTQTITVAYGGDRVYGRSTGSASATIAKSAISGMALDPNPPSYLPFVLEQNGSTPYDGSQSYWQYKFPVTVNTAAGVPTGTLTFMDNQSACPAGTSATGIGAAICAITGYSGVACPSQTDVSTGTGSGIQQIVNNGTLSSGAGAQFDTSCLPMPQNTTYTPIISTHLVTPVYSGDANFLGTTGSNATLFQVLRSPVVNITSSPALLNVPAGSSASATLTLTSLLGYGYAGKGSQLNDYNFPVTLTCDNLPPHSVCSFAYPSTVSPNQPTAPNSVQIPCSGTTAAADNCSSGTVTVTVTTNVTVGTTTSQNAVKASFTLASLFGFGMLGLFFRRRIYAKSRLLLMAFLIVVGGALAITLSACNTTNLAPNAVLSTPSGTYPMTITAQQVGTQSINIPTGSVQIYGSENQVSLPFYINVTVQ